MKETSEPDFNEYLAQARRIMMGIFAKVKTQDDALVATETVKLAVWSMIEARLQGIEKGLERLAFKG